MRIATLVATVVILMAAGCAETGSGGQEPGGGGSAELPWDRTFLSTEVIEEGQPRGLVDGTEISLTFARGELRAGAGCNHLSGQVSAEDGQLVLSSMGGTEMGCPPELHDQDAWLAGVLEARPTWSLAGDQLILRTATVELRLTDRRVAHPDRPLLETRWRVESLIDGETVASMPAGVEAQLVFLPGDRFEGTTGCNTVSGEAIPQPAGTLRFGEGAVTDVWCGEEAAEAAILAVLEGEVTVQIEADLLTLTHASGRGLQLRAD